MWFLVVVYNSFDPEFPKAITTPNQCIYTISSRHPNFVWREFNSKITISYDEMNKVHRGYDFRVYGKLMFDFDTPIKGDYIYILNITCGDANTFVSLNPPSSRDGRGKG